MGTRLDQRDGIDLWGDGIDLWGYVMGAYDWIREMGLICGACHWGVPRHGGTGLNQRDGIDL